MLLVTAWLADAQEIQIYSMCGFRLERITQASITSIKYGMAIIKQIFIQKNIKINIHLNLSS
jgi:hypothetical protein